MASVLLSDKTLRDPRLLTLMELTGRGRGELVGLLGLFWLKTRGAKKMTLQPEAAAPYIALPPGEAAGFAVCMAQAGYLEEKQGQSYIPDNVRYLETSGARQVAARKAGHASAAKRAQKKRPKKAAAVQALVVAAPAAPAPPVVAAEKVLSAGAQAFAAYAAEYTLRWGSPPLRDARTNAICLQIARRLGQDAPDIMRFYVRHDDRQYVLKLHPVEFALRDASALYSQFKRQQVMTFSQAQAAERGDNARTHTVRRQLDDIAQGKI